MLDRQGTFRSYCEDCGINECDRYEPRKDKRGNRCGYCGCAPIKHGIVGSIQREPCSSLISTVIKQMQAHSNRGEHSIPPAERVSLKKSRKGVKTPTVKPTGARRNGNKERFTLPCLSNVVQSAFQNGEVQSVWSVFIEECAEHFVQFQPGNHAEYGVIGKMIWNQFPCIESEGKTPWKRFTHCLSKRIRHLRMQMEKGPQKTDDSAICPSNNSGLSIIDFTGDTPTILLSNDRYEKESLEMKKQFLTEIPCEFIVKEIISRTFHTRNKKLREKACPSKTHSDFPCFNVFKYILYELELKVGASTMELIRANINIFLRCLRSHENNVDTVSAWEIMETYLMSLHRSSNVSKSLVRIAETDEAYATMVNCLETALPYVVVRRREPPEVVGCAFGSLINGVNTFEDAVLMLLAIYSIHEIPLIADKKSVIGILKAFAFGKTTPSELPRGALTYFEELSRFINISGNIS